MLQQAQIKTEKAISLPEDQYGHRGAPTEWWWHIGTLVTSDGRKFGFEINATNMNPIAFTQIAIIDIQQQRYLQKVNLIPQCPKNWAEYDSSKPWYVKLDGPSVDIRDGAVFMTSISNNPMYMDILATFNDLHTETPCKIKLKLVQQGSPLLVWGNGCKEVNPDGNTPLTRNNYYYSLTHLLAAGNITIGDDSYDVSGLTWMDHEYGAFPKNYKWLLQDIQLNNGIHLSNFTDGSLPIQNKPMRSNATILLKNGKSVFVNSITTPLPPTFVGEKGTLYYQNFKIEIDTPDIVASFLVSSAVSDQVFSDPMGADIYEGVANCIGVYNGVDVKGNAWIEQNLG